MEIRLLYILFHVCCFISWRCFFSGGGIVLLRATHEACKIQTTPNVCREDRGHVSIEFESENGVGWAMLEAYAEDKERLRIALELLGCQIKNRPTSI